MNNNPPHIIKVIDYSVTKQSFELIFNSELQLYKTNPQPSEVDLPEYYKSDDYISHTDANNSFIDKMYQTVKRITLQSKLNLIEKYVTTSEKNLLDIGCGTGDFLFTAQKKNWSVVGVEPNLKAADLANTKLNAESKIYTSMDALMNTHQKFSIITLWHVLEHVPDYDQYITKIKSLLHPNGILIIAVPNFNSFDAQFYKSHWAAFDVPRHLWHFSKFSITSIFSNHQMKVIKTKPMWFDAYYVSLLSEKYKTGGNIFLKPILIGMVSNFKSLFNKECSSLIYIIQNK